jgi:hypothetical protein
MLPILAFAKALDIKSWIIIGLSVALIGLWVTFQFQSIKVSSLKNDVAKKEVVIEQYKNNIVTLTGAVEKQNKAIDSLMDRNTEFEGALEGSAKQNARVSAEAERLIALLRKTKVPTDCSGATAHLNEFTVDFAKEWNK